MHSSEDDILPGLSILQLAMPPVHSKIHIHRETNESSRESENERGKQRGNDGPFDR